MIPTGTVPTLCTHYKSTEQQKRMCMNVCVCISVYVREVCAPVNARFRCMPSELCTTSLDRVGLAQYAPKLNNLHCVWVDQLANANVSRDAKLRLALLDELCPYPGHRWRLESWLAGLEPSAQHEKSAQPPSSLLQPRLWQRSLDQLRNSASARHRGKDPVFDPNCQSAPDPGLPSKVRVITEGRCTRRCMFTDGAAHSPHERNETIQAERQKRWTKAQN